MTAPEKEDILKILVINDSEADYELIQRELKMSGIRFSARLAGDQTNAKKAMSEYRPDIIIHDYNMPDFNIKEAAQIVRDYSSSKPIIVISEIVTEQLVVDSMRLGVKDYIFKDRLFRLPLSVKRVAEDLRLYEDRKKAVSELESLREDQIMYIVKNLPQRAFFKDVNSVYIYCNANYAKDLNMEPVDIAGRTDHDLFPEELADQYVSCDKRVMDSGQSESMEEDFYVTDRYSGKRQKLIVNTIKIPVKDVRGNVRGIVGIFWDVTEKKKAEESVLELNKQIEYILGVTKTGLDIIDESFNIIYVDQAWQKVYGDYKNKKCYEYFMGTKAKCPGCGAEKAIKTKTPVISEEILIKEGRRCIQVTSIPFKSKEGKWLVAEINVDITERKKLENNLMESEEKFRTIVNSMSDGVIIADIGTKKFIFGNDMICGMLGYSEEELVRLGVKDIHPEKALPGVIKIFESQARGENAIARDMPVKRKDGSVFYVDLFSRPVNMGGKNYLSGFFHDLTESKAIEKDRQNILECQKGINILRQSLLVPASIEEKFKMITDNIVKHFGAEFCGIWLIRPGDICDKGCAHVKTKDDLCKCSNHEKCLHLVSCSGVDMPIKEYDYSRIPFGCHKIGALISGDEYKILVNDAQNDPMVCNDKWKKECGFVSFAAYKIAISREECMGAFAIFAKYPIRPVEDVMLESIAKTTAFVIKQHSMEDERIKVLAIKNAVDMKSKFTSMVSHELRSPLGAIKEGINLVVEGLVGSINDQQKDLLNIVKNNVDRLARLINNVLDFQRMESKGTEFDMCDNNIGNIIIDVVKTIDILAKEKGLDIKLDIPGDLPLVRCDKDRINQVINNILSNAVKFMDNGVIFVKAVLRDDMVRVSVQDSGPGFEREEASRLFEPFEQLDSRRDKKKGGSGLGLAISRDIIIFHKGNIWAESEPGHGATFYFTLPVAK